VRVVDASAACLVAAPVARGAYALFEVELPAGAGVPAHRHRAEDEACYVVAGRVRFRAGRRTVTLGPGGCTFVPRGTVHAQTNVGPAPARLLVVVSPGAGDGRAFSELAAGFATGPAGTPELADAVWQIAATHGVERPRGRRARAARHPEPGAPHHR
jgi:quercetin dioxygenase-like cupin family protein